MLAGDNVTFEYLFSAKDFVWIALLINIWLAEIRILRFFFVILAYFFLFFIVCDRLQKISIKILRQCIRYEPIAISKLNGACINSYRIVRTLVHIITNILPHPGSI